MADEPVTWTVTVSQETDAAMRQHLATHGLTDRDLPHYIEVAVRWRLFDQQLARTLTPSAELRTGPPPEHFTQLGQQLDTAAISQLLEVLRPTAEPVECPTDQQLALAETEIGTKLPADYKQFIKHYGTGSVAAADHLGVYNPISAEPWINLVAQAKGSDQDAYVHLQKQWPQDFPYSRYPQPGGLLPWGHNFDGDVLYWWTITEPDHWPIVLFPRHSEGFRTFKPNMVRFIEHVIYGFGKEIFTGGEPLSREWTVPKG